MRVYIAAPWPLRKDAAQLRAQLAVAGIGCTSNWIDVEKRTASDVQRIKMAQMDLGDVRDADALVLLNPDSYENKGTGGRHVEVGYALALGRRVIVFGSISNIFHHLPEVTIINTLEALVEQLSLAGV